MTTHGPGIEADPPSPAGPHVFHPSGSNVGTGGPISTVADGTAVAAGTAAADGGAVTGDELKERAHPTTSMAAASAQASRRHARRRSVTRCHRLGVVTIIDLLATYGSHHDVSATSWDLRCTEEQQASKPGACCGMPASFGPASNEPPDGRTPQTTRTEASSATRSWSHVSAPGRTIGHPGLGFRSDQKQEGVWPLEGIELQRRPSGPSAMRIWVPRSRPDPLIGSVVAAAGRCEACEPDATGEGTGEGRSAPRSDGTGLALGLPTAPDGAGEGESGEPAQPAMRSALRSIAAPDLVTELSLERYGDTPTRPGSGCPADLASWREPEPTKRSTD